MACTGSTEIIDISDSDSEIGVISTTSRHEYNALDLQRDFSSWKSLSDSILVLESSDSDGSLESNSSPVQGVTPPHHTSTAPNANPDATIVLSSSDEESSILPLEVQRKKQTKSVPEKSKDPKSPAAKQKQSNLPVSHASKANSGISVQTKVVSRADAKLHRDVNKLVTEKKTTIKDFTVEIGHVHQNSPFVALVHEKLAAYGGSISFFEAPEEVKYLIRFRRRRLARYDTTNKEWIPVQEHTRLEDLYVVLLSADQLALAIAKESLSGTISALRDTHSLNYRSQVFFMIDGMSAYYKRRGGSKIKRSDLESEMTYLQAVERCFIVHVDGPEDVAQWLFNITGDLGIKPHKRIRDSFLPFCTDTKVKCGTSKSDTYKKMLQQIHGITESAADGIIEEVHTLRTLFEGYAKESDAHTRHNRLKEVTISNRKDGAAKSRIVNQALSKKVHDVIWGEDPLTLVL